MKDCLFVINMLNDFLHPQGALYCGDKVRNIIPRIQKKVNAYIDERKPVFVICDYHKKDDPELLHTKPHALQHTWGSEVVDGLDVSGTTRVNKNTESLFLTNLNQMTKLIREETPEMVEVVGVNTSVCVLEAVKGLFALKVKNIIVPVRCVGDIDTVAAEKALNVMKNVFNVKLV